MLLLIGATCLLVQQQNLMSLQVIDLTFIGYSAGYLAGYLLGFWYLYLIVMGLYRAHLAKRLSKFAGAVDC